MALFEGKTPAERNKTIAAIVFGGVALLLLLRLFFFGGTGATRTTNANNPRPPRSTAGASSPDAAADEADRIDTPPREVRIMTAAYTGGEPGRNIFAFYVPPPPTPTPAAAETPPPTPTPPSLILASVSPQSVYAQTGEFKMQVSGDKFTPAVRVYVDGQEVPTQFGGPQQLTATVPAFIISAPGARTVMARTPDNQLFSNTATVNVMQPPVPNYTYIGFINPAARNNDKAILRDQKNELLTVQVNDVIGGRFRVTGITAREVELTDKDLKIKHKLAYTDARASGPVGPAPRGAIQPPPKADDDDEEP